LRDTKMVQNSSTMNITLKDIPPDLHGRLRKAADASGRSLNKLILHTLDQALSPRQVDRSELLQRIRSRREGMTGWLDDTTLRSAIQAGRE